MRTRQTGSPSSQDPQLVSSEGRQLPLGDQEGPKEQGCSHRGPAGVRVLWQQEMVGQDAERRPGPLESGVGVGVTGAQSGRNLSWGEVRLCVPG